MNTDAIKMLLPKAQSYEIVNFKMKSAYGIRAINIFKACWLAALVMTVMSELQTV